MSVLSLFSVLPQAMISTLVSVPWDLLLFVCVRACVELCTIYFLFSFVHMFKHRCGGFTVCTCTIMHEW